MAIENVNPAFRSTSIADIAQRLEQPAQSNRTFQKTITNYVKDVDQDQNQANANIVDLLSGKTNDVNAVVTSVARADMSFKMLVGVRNKLVEAYKETMKMQV